MLLRTQARLQQQGGRGRKQQQGGEQEGLGQDVWSSVAHLAMVLRCLCLWDVEPSRELLGRVAELLPELQERSVLAEASPDSFFKPLCSVLLVRRCRVGT